MNLDDPRLEKLLGMLSLEEKVLILTGKDFWSTWPLESIGLRRMVVSDGPSGVRGEVWDERSPSLNLPSATALASSWDQQVARRYGRVSAQEAQRKNVDVVLGPTINIHRSPLGGRHFEALSEDPVLTASLAAAYVEGVQSKGVGATPKHYVANDYETERFTASTDVDERTLREVYLRAFEDAIVDARAWLVMSAYNAINGTTATESELLRNPLKDEWGFDGVVISDWTAVRSIEAAKAGQDLVMPGPEGPWGDALVQAIRAGDVDEALIDDKIRRLLLLAARVGALEGFEREITDTVEEDGPAFAREAAVEGTVLLTNDGLLPLTGTLKSVAVIGHNALQARTQGGGSATVLPEHVVTPLEGLRSALPETEVRYAQGAVVQEGIAELPLERIMNPSTGTPGMLVRFLDESGEELFVENRRATALTYFGGDAPLTSATTLEMATRWTPESDGSVLLGFAALGNGRVWADGELLIEGAGEAIGDDLGAALLAPPSVSAALSVRAGTPVELRLEFDLAARESVLSGTLGIILGTEPDTSDPDGLIAEAAALAASCEVAVVVVGTNSKVESEGYDRAGLALPGRQDDLVEAVLATGTPTVVVVNAGAPVLLPWRARANAVVLPYFGGQEMGDALADVLLGHAEPGGRLPTTWPGEQNDVPVLDVTPKDGHLAYTEGIHVGHRAWLRAGTAPAYAFGHGLGYTTWQLSGLEISDRTVRLNVVNTGERPGKQVVQVYLSRTETDVDRPTRWLAAWTVVRSFPTVVSEVEIVLPERSFAHWSDGWVTEPGVFNVHVGTSILDTALSAEIEI